MANARRKTPLKNAPVEKMNDGMWPGVYILTNEFCAMKGKSKFHSLKIEIQN